MKPSLQVRLSQHLALTPQLQQSIRLLQLSTLELHQEVEQMLEQNPFLEAEDDSGAVVEPLAERTRAAERAAERETERAAEAGAEAATSEPPAIDGAEFGTTERDDWENGTERDDFDGIRETPGKTQRPATTATTSTARDRDARVDDAAGPPARAAVGLRLSADDAAAVMVLIESLNDDGYLADSLEEIAERQLGRRRRRRGRRARRAARAAAAARCAACRAWSRPASARATWPNA